MERDLKTELLRAEEDHFNKTLGEKRKRHIPEAEHNKNNGHKDSLGSDKKPKLSELLEASKNQDDDNSSSGDDSDDDPDRESDGGSEQDDQESDSESESEDDSEDELQRELEKIKQERAEQKLREEEKQKARELEEREKEIAYGNPLLNPGSSSNSGTSSRRKWNDDVVFKNQAKGVDDKPDQGFINDMIRSDFHRKFMNKYIR